MVFRAFLQLADRRVQRLPAVWSPGLGSGTNPQCPSCTICRLGPDTCADPVMPGVFGIRIKSIIECSRREISEVDRDFNRPDPSRCFGTDPRRERLLGKSGA